MFINLSKKLKYITIILLSCSIYNAEAVRFCPADMVMWTPQGSPESDCKCPLNRKMVTDLSQSPYRFGKCQDSYSLSNYLTPTLPSLGTLTLWLDADDPFNNGYKPASGTAISTWYDKSGKGNNATQGNATYQPSYVISADANGRNRPAMYFNGTTYFSIPGLGAILNVGNSSYTIFAVVNLVADNGGDLDTIISWGPEANLESVLIRFVYQSGVTLTTMQDWSSDYLFGTTVLSFGTYYNTTYIYNNASGRSSYINGVLDSSDADTSLNQAGGVAANQTPAYIGGFPRTPPIQLWNGYMCEIIVYTTALTAAQIATVEAYLNQKWIIH